MSHNPAPATGTPIDRERDLIAAARRQVSPRPGSDSIAITRPIPDSVPGYEIVREIHRGGQGVVYQAIQKATTRKVAIKVMKEGAFAGPRDKARFDREVEILAQLEHPNIVGIVDSGEAGGSLYFVMDYISGKSLDAFISEHELSIDAALALFSKICDAVNAAHLKGVIHRDLKPGNIRVDGSGEPHILDFGLAKIATGSVSDESHPHVMTMTGQFVGSLPWASPEQAAGAVGEIDLRTDVYSLGVILYQMLTGGRFPYKVIGNMRDVLDAIMKAEPAKPSTVRRQIDDEVETIVLKSLSKERDRRYQSAGELGRDVKRYLAGEPIEAKRDSGWYLLSKTLNRYRVPAGVAAGFVVLLAAFAVAMSVLYQKASAAEEDARDGQAAAVAARDEEAEQRRRAEANFAAAREMARTFLFDFNDRIENLRGATAARELVLKKGLEYLAELQAQKPDDPALLRELAEAYDRVGDIQGGLYLPRVGTGTQAAESFAQARRIREELLAKSPDDASLRAEFAESLAKSAGALQTARKYGDARREYDAAISEYARALGAPAVKDADAREWRGETERSRARTLHRRAGLLRDMAMAAKDDAEARGLIDDVRADYAAVGEWCRARLAADASDDRAASLLAQGLIGESACRVVLGRRLRSAGDAKRDAQDAAGALALYRDAIANFESGAEPAANAASGLRALAERSSANAELARNQYIAWHNLGEAWMRVGNTAEESKALLDGADRAAMEERERSARERALEAFEQALDITRRLASADEANIEARRDVAICLNKLTNMLAALGRLQEAAVAAQESLDLRRDLLRTDPTQRHRLDVGVALFRRAEIDEDRAAPQPAGELKRGYLMNAERLFAEAVEVFGGLSVDGVLSPDSPEVKNSKRDLDTVRKRLSEN